MHGYSTCIIIPVKGRLWLPPDQEQAQNLIFRLACHYDKESKAEHRGEEHVRKNRQRVHECQAALDLLIKHQKAVHPSC